MLRRLEEKDAPFMLEWMHDDTVNCNFQYPFAEMTLEKVRTFIENSFDEENRHFAIIDENDEYLGTISLKNISQKNQNAEYAIVTRKKAQGTGAARQATQELLQYAFEEIGLHKIYLNVLSENMRARKFYENCGFVQEGISKDAVRINDKYESLVWYGIFNKAQKGIQEKVEKKDKPHYMSLEYVQKKLAEIEDWMDKVENNELTMEAQESEYGSYDDYWSDDVEWDYYDDKKIGAKIEAAFSFAQDCVNDRWYEQALLIFDRLIDMEVCVESEWDNMSINLEDMIEEKLADVDIKKLALMTLYSDYQVGESKERAEDIYSYFRYNCFRDISVRDMFCVGREELTDVEQFWEDWIELLTEKKGDKEAELLKEAVLYRKGVEGMAELASKCGQIHPSLYLQVMEEYKKVHRYQDMQKLGETALKQLQTQLVMRSSIALQTAYAAECNGDESAKNRCWYEAYRSESTEKNYLRLYSTEECAKTYGLKTVADSHLREKSNSYVFVPNQELKQNVIHSDTWNCLLFLQGELEEVKRKCVNPQGSLGWSGSFIRTGIKLFLVYLYAGKNTTKAIKSLANDLSRDFGYDKIELFWEAWNSWKKYYPLEETKQKRYLKWLEDTIDKRTHAIVGGQHRSQYAEAAVLIATLGDVYAAIGDDVNKHTLVAKYLKCYPRHSAFRGELGKYV